jgi:hypothetical protein
MTDELTPKQFEISKLPAKKAPDELTSAQLPLPLGVEKQVEIDGVGMGVLSDGTPFLTQRGLARLVDMENLHIRTISIEWNSNPPKPRIEAIKRILWGRGQEFATPHIEVKHGGQTMHAIPDAVCLAVLEYYAFDAAQTRPTALKNFRLLAGKALREFIYAQVGYDPKETVPQVWRQFHDRVSLTYNACPPGYWGVFKEIADMIVTLGQAGLHISADFVPDISVGRAWAQHWEDGGLTEAFGARRKYEHRYPEYFPQAASNPQEPWCYPESALGEFRRWFRESYVGEGKFAKYLSATVKKLALPPSFAQLALQAYKTEGEA